MAYWDKKVAATGNIRLYIRGEGWRAHDDEKNDKGEISVRGTARAVEEILTSALNASNLILLTGAGSSFCAKNVGNTAKQAPGMGDLWSAVVEKATPEAIDEIAKLMPNAKAVVDTKNIEKFLTHCKIYLELFGPATAKKVADFITLAEKTIAERVDFVTATTDLGPRLITSS